MAFCNLPLQCGKVHIVPTSHLDLGVDVEEGEESVHVYQGLPGLSVHRAEEVEREGELEEQAVHHHQVSHGHRACATATAALRHAQDAQLDSSSRVSLLDTRSEK